MSAPTARDAGITGSIAAERQELATILAGLPPQSWDSPTLCAGWRVRELVAHITMPFRYRPARFAFEMIRSRGNFNRMADRCARRDAAAPPDQLTAALRDNAGNPWKPPGGGYQGALTHDVIHGLDITVALGLGRRVPRERLGIVLDGITGAKSVRFFGTDLGGIELRADDLDWSFGSGTPVSGSAQDLALVVCGRKLPPGHLRGGPSARFTG
ncbi:MAG: maleylpyruvate isomerase family mycothiol-dependent enzyme [Streptosporangiaceae bacterium]